MNIIQKPSPNQDNNRVKIDRVVVHWIVGNLASADAVFAKVDSTSAHYGIEDNTIHQYVAENRVAYHAGNYPMNQRSIGIEHSAAPDRPASEATYQTSGKLIAEIAKRHNIPLDRTHIIGHKEVKATQCPGTIDIDKLIKIAKGGVDMNELDKLREERDHNWNLYVNQQEEARKERVERDKNWRLYQDALAKIKELEARPTTNPKAEALYKAVREATK
jgi:N-acetyl-anhydromuramyl-L-alanine amidase AmpD